MGENNHWSPSKEPEGTSGFPLLTTLLQTSQRDGAVPLSLTSIVKGFGGRGEGGVGESYFQGG